MFKRTVNDPDYYYQILNNDEELNNLLKESGSYLYIEEVRRVRYDQLISIINVEEINIDYLIYECKTRIFDFLDLNYLNDIIEQILYTFKYGTVKNFFRDNWFRFIPEFDKQLIDYNEQVKLLQNAFMSEFDYFSQVITEMHLINDIDRIPAKYLDYVGQLLGYERTANEKIFLTDEFFRIFLKNLIDIYNRKGTNFVVELFFNFIGYEATIEEFWFDRRFYDLNVLKNSNTGSSDNKEYLFYLTKSDPRDGYNIGDIYFPKLPEKNFTTHCPNLYLFNYKCTGNDKTHTNVTKISLETLLNEYSYFKTNFVNIKLKAFKSSLPSGELTMSPTDKKIIDGFFSFVAPIFIIKKYETLSDQLDGEKFLKNIGLTLNNATKNLTDLITTSLSNLVEVGDYITGTGIPDNTYVIEVMDTTNFRISNNATDSLTSTLTYYKGMELIDYNDTGTDPDSWTDKAKTGLGEYWYDMINKTIDYYGYGYVKQYDTSDTDVVSMFSDRERVLEFRHLDNFGMNFYSSFDKNYYEINASSDNYIISDNIIIYKVV